jgi:hypothetical protein
MDRSSGGIETIFRMALVIPLSMNKNLEKKL